MITYSSLDEIEKYYNSERINQSLLKGILYKGALALNPDTNKQSKALKLGSAIDTILTSNIPFEEQFIIGENIDLSPSELKIFKNLSEREIKPEDITKENVIETLNLVNFQSNWKDDTRYNKVKNTITNKYPLYFKYKDKNVISEEEYEHIINILAEAEKVPIFYNIFNPEDSRLIEHHFQLPIYFRYEDIDMKALLDKVEFHMNNKGEIEKVIIYDLKTMEGNVENFYKNVKRFRYDFQMAFYKIAVEQLLKDKKKARFITYEYYFPVISSTIPGNLVVYKVDDITINTAIKGYEPVLNSVYYNKKRIKGIEEAISLYKYYKSNPELKVSKIIKENNYKIDLILYED